ncbi:large ribosomal subunit protein mL64 [Anolis carolinensis]|uniref:Large ribosomal subunit protein mL64 n=1 Tax=Anolis carolinensis TaxID=28377 RepID=G1KTI2_ANOCA|nr:PREDICTED: growth arrest and DNA damage-inducible proteins-interacting protein 1 [Anolis carolinensis]|eukprot:XP_003216861.1 PREDICTED: growth arrest and DNA damage-inducible proteins-interacting protein 1 [Anolis carolinensis]
MAAVLGTREVCSKMAAQASRLVLTGGVRFYNARPLRRQLGGIYRPDPADPRTPAWQLTGAYEAKLFGRYGAASGVDPARLWPSPAQLKEMEEDERVWCPPLRDMQERLDAKEREANAKARQREELIASKMAKMPQMIAEWKQQKALKKAKELEEKERRQLLLAEARERFGYNLDHRSPQFQEMMQEMEKTRRKEQKLMKKKRREETLVKKAMEGAAVVPVLTKHEEVATTEVLHHQGAETTESS